MLRTKICRLLFKLDVSILIFACLCCKCSIIPGSYVQLANKIVFVKYLGKRFVQQSNHANWHQQTRQISPMPMSVVLKKTLISMGTSSITSTFAITLHMWYFRSLVYSCYPAQNCNYYIPIPIHRQPLINHTEHVGFFQVLKSCGESAHLHSVA